MTELTIFTIFHYKKEGATIMCQADLNELGYEGVPKMPLKKERLNTIKTILRFR